MIQMTTSRRQNAKKGARLASPAARPAKRSKNPTSLDTWLGISTGLRAVRADGGSTVWAIGNTPSLVNASAALPGSGATLPGGGRPRWQSPTRCGYSLRVDSYGTSSVAARGPVMPRASGQATPVGDARDD